jgi:hypothetical protein
MSVHVPAPKVLTYKTGNADKLLARAVIGDAQQGGWVIGFDPASLKKGSDPDTVPVGSAKDVAGKILQVVVTAVDVRPETNRLSATTTISGGADGTKSIVHTFEEGDKGDIAIFTTLVVFE